jgi:hypothetical protein
VMSRSFLPNMVRTHLVIGALLRVENDEFGTKCVIESHIYFFIKNPQLLYFSIKVGKHIECVCKELT